MNKYETLVNKIIAESDITNEELLKRVKLAQLWHNPRNYSDGNDLKEFYNWTHTFTDALEEEGLGHRYYFAFKDYDLTDVNICYQAFLNCKNFKKYCKVWKKYAPEGLKNPAIYLLAIVELTTRGFSHEKDVKIKLEKAGKKVIEATPEEDLKGIDFWVDGSPIQVKSPATFKNMKKINYTVIGEEI